MIKRRVLSSTSASSLPPASAFCRLFSTRRVGAQQPVSRRGIATDFSRCGYLATGNFAWSGGNLYAVIGGLRAMAVADSINGIGLVIGGLMVPVFGLIAMGKGSFMQGIEQLTTVHAEN